MASASDIRAGRAFYELYADRSPFVRGLRLAERELRQWGERARGVGQSIAIAGAALSAPFVLATRTFVRMGDEVQKTALRTGIGAEALSALGYAAGQSGASMDAVAKGLGRLARVQNDARRGTATAIETFDALGVSLQSLSALSPEEQFARVADAVASIEDPMRRAALAQEVFGRGGQELMPLLLEQTRGIAALVAEAKRLDLVVSQEDADAAAALGDAFDRVASAVRMVAFRVGSALAPTLTRTADAVASIVAELSRFVGANRGLVVALAAAAASVLVVGVAIAGLGFTMIALSAIAGGLASALGVLGVAVAAIASPLGLVALGAVSAASAVVALNDDVRSMVSDSVSALGEFAQSWAVVLQGALKALASGNVSGAAGVLFLSLEGAFQAGFASLLGAVLEFSVGFTAQFFDLFARVERGFNSFVAAIQSGTLSTAGRIAELIGEATGSDALIGIGVGLRAAGNARAAVGASEANARTDAELQARLDELVGVQSGVRAALIDPLGRAAELARTRADELARALVGGGSGSVPVFGARDEDQARSETVGVGAFNAAAARLLGAGDTKQERIVRATEETARYARETADALRSRGGVFA